MDSIEGNIRLLLQGKEVEESQDFCDFTLQDQNEVTGRNEGRKEREAAKREVLEETGMEADITTLLMVESAAGSWFRFVVTGNVLDKVVGFRFVVPRRVSLLSYIEGRPPMVVRRRPSHPGQSQGLGGIHTSHLTLLTTHDCPADDDLYCVRGDGGGGDVLK
ncbi:hypothetical protein E2C01_008257 [Portunus trituberculatus]|uniref:Nudix hydrolase domain-containing protein n=1 Tax=Portunus trituberculatus TaxID=210409 RepID=A0A5B7D4A1_PORTR|nr:hypothetical protein [Portunus trituberculatus]